MKSAETTGDKDQVQRELDVLNRCYPLLDRFTRTNMLCILLQGLDQEHRRTASLDPSAQEMSGRILDLIKEWYPDDKATPESGKQTEAEDVYIRGYVEAADTGDRSSDDSIIEGFTEEINA